jgi:hypothetical protein
MTISITHNIIRRPDPMDKSTFKGIIISIQPRIKLTKPFDEATHKYLDYAIS